MMARPLPPISVTPPFSRIRHLCYEDDSNKKLVLENAGADALVRALKLVRGGGGAASVRTPQPIHPPPLQCDCDAAVTRQVASTISILATSSSLGDTGKDCFTVAGALPELVTALNLNVGDSECVRALAKSVSTLVAGAGASATKAKDLALAAGAAHALDAAISRGGLSEGALEAAKVCLRRLTGR